MKTVATIQVRMGSSRLPGKALKEVMGKPLLGYLIERVRLAKSVDDVVVATSINVENDAIESFCHDMGVACFRGSEDDVLDRMVGALQSMDADVGVEIFGDCPLIDPAIVDHMIDLFSKESGAWDFVGNDLETTYPPGMEVEVFALTALEKAHTSTTDPAIREHGTLFIRQNPEVFKVKSVVAPKHHHFPELEIEVDSPEDFQVISKVLEDLYPQNPGFSLDDILLYAQNNPELFKVNAAVHRRWKDYRDSQ